MLISCLYTKDDIGDLSDLQWTKEGGHIIDGESSPRYFFRKFFTPKYEICAFPIRFFFRVKGTSKLFPSKGSGKSIELFKKELWFCFDY